MKEETFSYLDLLYKEGKKKGHEIVLEVLEQLDNPQDKLKIIHVAGTNGKGSVCAMVKSILQAEGFSVGLFTSPHLETPKERFVYNQMMISDEEFLHGVELIKKAQEVVFQNAEDMISYFEFLTVLAFWFFNEKQVDFLLLEAGIGGRLDSTNVIDTSLVSVITSIGFDHTDILGDTIYSIASEKAGIIKENGVLVFDSTNEDVLKAVYEQAKNKHVTIYNMKDTKMTIIEKNIEKTKAHIESPFFEPIDIEIYMIGEYQIKNAILSLGVIHALNMQGIKIDKDSILRGFMNARWPGRMEIMQKDPILMLDGAHNIDGAKNLVSSLKNLFPFGKEDIVLVVGILADKEHKKLLMILSEVADTIFITEASSYRAYKAEDLYDEMVEIDNQKNIFLEPSPVEAIEKALSFAKEEHKQAVIVAGSLYLVGEAREYLTHQ